MDTRSVVYVIECSIGISMAVWLICILLDRLPRARKFCGSPVLLLVAAANSIVACAAIFVAMCLLGHVLYPHTYVALFAACIQAVHFRKTWQRWRASIRWNQEYNHPNQDGIHLPKLKHLLQLPIMSAADMQISENTTCIQAELCELLKKQVLSTSTNIEEVQITPWLHQLIAGNVHSISQIMQRMPTFRYTANTTPPEYFVRRDIIAALHTLISGQGNLN